MNARYSKWRAGLKRAGLLAMGLATLTPHRSSADGNWLSLNDTAPDSVSFMLLLSDGTVMAANNPDDIFGDFGGNWYRLTPDPNGHYVLGEWSSISSMNYARHAFASQVLTNGMVFVAGGEHPVGGPGTSSAEIYNPLLDSWTIINPPPSMMNGTQTSPQGFSPPQNQAFLDCESRLLPNGTVLMAPVAPSVVNGTLIYNPSANAWSQGPPSLTWQAEASWVGLPDSSILTVDHDSSNSERFIPSLNQWIRDANVPVNLWANMGPKLVGEIGPAFLLPNGQAFFLGGSGHTAIYTPSGYTNAGSWVAGPDIPSGLASADAPAAMMANGRILCAVAPVPSGDNNGNPTFPTPTSFFEYDYSVGPVGTFTQVSGPTGTTDNVRPQDTSMLVLADATVLYCHVEEGNLFYSPFGSQLYVYVPIGPQVASGAPVIKSITPNLNGSFHLTGTGLTGISEGAAFGDDAQMACNYPLVMFKDTNNGHVDYCRTYSWTSTGVQTGGAIQSTEFSLAPGLIPETYLVSVTAAGLTSAPVTFSFVLPTTLSMCPGDSGTLSVLTSPQPATYQWLFNNNPISGQTNSVLDFVSATTNQSGFYSLKVTSGSGTYVSLPVQVSVGVWVIQPPPITNSATICQPYTLSLLAQGKGTLTAQWFRSGNLIVPDSRVTTNSVAQAGGGTTLSLSFSDIGYRDDGTYTAVVSDDCGPVTTPPFTLRVVPNPPWVQVATQGPPSRSYAAMAYDSDRHVSVLFGGLTNNSSGTFSGDTWEFDGLNWTQRFPTISPAARDLAQMVYDSQRHRTVLFGGQIISPNGQTQISLDTWEWDGTNWQQIVTLHVPDWTEPIAFASCYDSVRGETLIFGGLNSMGRLYELWGYDGSDWTQKNPTGPTPVTANSGLMTFDSFRGVAVLLGGNEQSVHVPYPAGSVWEWDGSIWHERPQSGQIFGGVGVQDVLAFDTFRNESVLYGYVFGIIDGVGSSSFPYYPQGYRFVWRWNGQDWQADPPTPTLGGTAVQIASSMCFDTSRNAIVLFGGQDDNGAFDTNYTFEILYQDDPAVLKQPNIEASLVGQQAQLSVVAAGAPPIAYQWQKGGKNLTDNGHIAGSATNTLTLNGAMAGDSGFYQLSMSNLCGMAVSQTILLNVTAGAHTIAIGAIGPSNGNGSSTVITWGDSSTLLQTATNAIGPWATITNAISPYTINPVMPAQYFRLLFQ